MKENSCEYYLSCSVAIKLLYSYSLKSFKGNFKLVFKVRLTRHTKEDLCTEVYSCYAYLICFRWKCVIQKIKVPHLTGPFCLLNSFSNPPHYKLCIYIYKKNYYFFLFCAWDYINIVYFVFLFCIFDNTLTSVSNTYPAWLAWFSIVHDSGRCVIYYTGYFTKKW